MNGAKTGTMTSSHVLIEGFNGVGSGQLSELLIHVVGSRTRVVTEPDAEVLDFQWALLMDLNTSKPLVNWAASLYGSHHIPH
jgi:hypothetical protein